MFSIFLSFLGVLLVMIFSGLAVWLVSALSDKYGGDEAILPDMDRVKPAIKPKHKIRQAAVIRCKGFGPDIARDRFLYDGLASCQLAHQTAGGFKACSVGCLSLGDCARACEREALNMNEAGVPVVDLSKCSACGHCVAACPRGIISLVPMQPQYMVSCMSHEKGLIVQADCSVGCNACGKCIKVCEYAAIGVVDSLAVIDPEKCVACGACAKVCPLHCIDYVDTTVTL